MKSSLMKLMFGASILVLIVMITIQSQIFQIVTLGFLAGMIIWMVILGAFFLIFLGIIDIISEKESKKTNKAMGMGHKKEVENG